MRLWIIFGRRLDEVPVRWFPCTHYQPQISEREAKEKAIRKTQQIDGFEFKAVPYERVEE